MTENRITELFGINPASSVPLRTQLERKLELFINSSVPGTVIPAERIMAKCLGISRVTVRNAITPFLASGAIVRHGRSGTAVAPRKVQTEVSVNELAIGLPWHIQPVTTLKFLCYETLPEQRSFWEMAVDEFNAVHNNCQVEIVWLDKVLKGHAMLNFIAQNEIDVMLHSKMYELPLESFAVELPADLQNITENEEFLFRDIWVGDKNQFCFLLPFQIVFGRVFYNSDLAAKCGLENVSERLFNNEKVELMLEAMQKLDKSKMASSHIWCHLAYQGVMPQEKNLPQLVDVLEKMRVARHYNNAFMLSQTHSLDDAEKFINGDMLFFDGIYPQLQTVGRPSFNMKQQIALPSDSADKFAQYIGIAITSQCRNYEFAVDFLRILISDKVQKLIADIKNEFPVKKELCKYAAEKQCDLEPQQFEKVLQKTFLFQNIDSEKELSIYFYIFKCRDLLKKMMQDKISAEECAALIIQGWKSFYNKEASSNV